MLSSNLVIMMVMVIQI